MIAQKFDLTLPEIREILSGLPGMPSKGVSIPFASSVILVVVSGVSLSPQIFRTE